jgi:predicted dehydrogenase
MMDVSAGNAKQPIKIAILGARGIGKVHARLFHSLGAEVYAILGSSPDTASLTAQDLLASFGFKPKAFNNLQTLLSEPINAVGICTPPRLHYQQMVAALDKNLPVFCEKPLFWNDHFSVNDVKDKLAELGAHPNRRIFMNAPNALFLDAMHGRFDPSTIDSLKFSFYTNGNYSGVGIGMDLYTHGLSILYKIFGTQNASDFKFETTTGTFSCWFNYGNCAVEFDFRENPKGPKHFSLTLNERVFTRIQEGNASTYKLYFHDSATGEKIAVQDPFIQSIQTFIDYCSKGAPVKRDQFEEAQMIMGIMAEHLILKRK